MPDQKQKNKIILTPGNINRVVEVQIWHLLYQKKIKKIQSSDIYPKSGFQSHSAGNWRLKKTFFEMMKDFKNW